MLEIAHTDNVQSSLKKDAESVTCFTLKDLRTTSKFELENNRLQIIGHSGDACDLILTK